MSEEDRLRWEGKYSTVQKSPVLSPDDWLIASVGEIRSGRAMELACGLGHNAIWLAKCGCVVDAVDISPGGLKLAAERAAVDEVAVNWIAADLDDWVPEENAYDLVVVFRFLERTRLPELIERALRPGGVLLYETFTVAHLTRPESRMKNPAFALAPGELPRLFPGLEVIEYTEVDLADRSVARLMARKRRGDK